MNVQGLNENHFSLHMVIVPSIPKQIIKEWVVLFPRRSLITETVCIQILCTHLILGSYRSKQVRYDDVFCHLNHFFSFAMNICICECIWFFSIVIWLVWITTIHFYPSIHPCRQTDRRTDRQAWRQRDRQTDKGHGNYLVKF